MYKKRRQMASTLRVNDSIEGETIERRVERMMAGKEPITDAVDTIYTARKDGVQAQYNIRTDRFELAIDATDRMNASLSAKRESLAQRKQKDREPESTQGKGVNSTAEPKNE